MAGEPSVQEMSNDQLDMDAHMMMMEDNLN